MMLPFDPMTAATAPLLALHTDHRKRQRGNFYTRRMVQRAKIEAYVDKMQNAEQSILLAFLFDATSSMQPYMPQCRNVIQQLARHFVRNFKKMDLRIAAMLYRDPLEGTDHAEALEPVEEDAFRKYMDNARPMGGGDEAEDVAGGWEKLNAVLDGAASAFAAERTDDASPPKLILIHVLDAPAHGYSNGFRDNHDTCEQRERLKQAVADFVRIGTTGFAEFEYHFFGVKDILDSFCVTMHALVKESLPKGYPRRMDEIFHQMNPREEFSTSLMQSTFESVSAALPPPPHFHDPFAVPTDPGAPVTSTAVDDLTRHGLRVLEDTDASNRCPTHLAEDKGTVIGILDCTITKPCRPTMSPAFLFGLVEYCKDAPTYDAFHETRTNWWNRLAAIPACAANRIQVDTTNTEQPLLLLSTRPIGRGKEHVAFHGQFTSLSSEEEVARVKRDVRRGGVWYAAGTGEKKEEAEAASSPPSWAARFHPVVIKLKITHNADVRPKLEIFAAVKCLVDHFNHFKSAHSIGFDDVELVSPFAMQFSADKTVFMGADRSVFVAPRSSATFDYSVLGEHSLAEYPGAYTKWISNNGVSNYHMDPTLNSDYEEHHCSLHAFVLYCWRVTMGNMVPSDLQGKLVYRDGFARVTGVPEDKAPPTTFLLTDVVCTCNNEQAFDADVNLGSIFVRKLAAEALRGLETGAPDKLDALLTAMGPSVRAADFESLRD